MHLRHFRSFTAVVEVRNLCRAAAALRVAQPALSRQIHDLEAEIGVPLLERHPRGVSPTPAGEVLARGASEILRDIGAAIDRAERAATGQSGRVVLGLPRVILARGLATTLERQLREQHPDVSLILREVEPGEVWNRVAAGTLDVGVDILPVSRSDITVEPIWDVAITRALIPATHVLAGRQSVRAAELSAMPFLVPPRGLPPQLIQEAVRQLKAAGARSPLLTLETGLGGAHMMVAAGRGWCVLSEEQAHFPPAGTAAPLLEGFNVRVAAGVAWRRHEHRSLVRRLVELTLEFARSVAGSTVRAAPALPSGAPAHATRRRVPGSVPRELETRHLAALLEVAASQSIRGAADRLGVTQPALSRQIHELESALGFALLHRRGWGVSLTTGGTALASECPALLGAVEQLTRETTRARRGMQGHCVVGAVTGVSMNNLMGEMLTRLAQQHPHLHVIIDEIPSPELPAALRDGRIDLALQHPWPTDDDANELSRERVLDDRFDLALVSTFHPLAQRAEVTAGDLATVPFLFIDRDFHPPLFDLVMSSLASIGLQPLIQSTCEGRYTRWMLAAEGVGWCLVSRSTSTEPPAGTVGIRIAGLNIPWGVDLVWRKGEPSVSVRAVMKALRAAGAARTVVLPVPPSKAAHAASAGRGQAKTTRRATPSARPGKA